MYNSQNSSPIELPSSKQLARSTIFALLTASCVIGQRHLTCRVCYRPNRHWTPAGSYSDGEIKQELAREG